MMAKVEEEIKWKGLFCWSGEHEIELFNSWDMSAEELKKKKNWPVTGWESKILLSHVAVS